MTVEFQTEIAARVSRRVGKRGNVRITGPSVDGRPIAALLVALAAVAFVFSPLGVASAGSQPDGALPPARQAPPPVLVSAVWDWNRTRWPLRPIRWLPEPTAMHASSCWALPRGHRVYA